MQDQTVTQAADWPIPVERVNATGRSPLLLVCEHATNHIPACYQGLGLSPEDLDRHIAWDIGAAALTRRLAAMLDAPAFLGTYSRLLIDLNRPLGIPGSIPARSEATIIPGNEALDGQERDRRRDRIFAPFQQAITTFIDRRIDAGLPTILIAVHSFTPVFLGVARPWHAGVLFGNAKALGHRLVARLAEDSALSVAANQPYTVSRQEDYAILVHGDDRHIPAVLIEIRNDGLSDRAAVEEWAERLTAALRPELAP